MGVVHCILSEPSSTIDTIKIIVTQSLFFYFFVGQSNTACMQRKSEQIARNTKETGKRVQQKIKRKWEDREGEENDGKKKMNSNKQETRFQHQRQKQKKREGGRKTGNDDALRRFENMSLQTLLHSAAHVI
jgi:hypothetical protein